MNSLKRVRAFQIELEFESVVFLRGGGNRSSRRKTSRSKGENQQQTPGVEPGPQWWEASALTTATPLLPKLYIDYT